MRLNVVTTDLMIVDGDYLSHRGYYAFTRPDNPSATLRTSSGVESGAFFGFFSLLLRKIRDYGPKRIAICWSDKRSNLYRMTILPSYKSNRETTPSSLISQTEDIKKALFYLDIPQFLTPTREADDLIAALAYRESKKDLRIRIISNDKDFMQLVTDKVSLVTLATGTVKVDTEYFPDDVVKRYEIPPSLIADYLALIGDSSDGISGIEGIGPKTASKILRENGSIRDWFKTIESIKTTDLIKKKLIDSKEKLIINKKLVSLKSSQGIETQPVFFDSNELTESSEIIFDKYEMKKIRPRDFLVCV